MRIRPLIRAVLLAIWPISITSTSKDDTCGTYLAESTIPGAGLGMFTGHDFSTGEEITPGDIILPILEFGWHAGEDTYLLWDEYTWSAYG